MKAHRFKNAIGEILLFSFLPLFLSSHYLVVLYYSKCLLTDVCYIYHIDCLSFFRTMGLRHLVVVDGDHKAVGMITRHDITEHRLEHHWFQEVSIGRCRFI